MRAVLALVTTAWIGVAMTVGAARAQEPRVIDLNGAWDDKGHAVWITQIGGTVTAVYDSPPLCDPQDGSEPQPRDFDFTATLIGDSLVGKATVCNHGESWGDKIGIQEVDMVLEVSEDGSRLEGTYEGWPATYDMTLTRDCDTDFEIGLVDGTWPLRETLEQAVRRVLAARGVEPYGVEVLEPSRNVVILDGQNWVLFNTEHSTPCTIIVYALHFGGDPQHPIPLDEPMKGSGPRTPKGLQRALDEAFRFLEGFEPGPPPPPRAPS